VITLFEDGAASAVGMGGVSLIVAGVLIALGAVMWLSGSRSSGTKSAVRRERRSRSATSDRASGRAWALADATLATAVVAGVQWAILRPTGALWVSVLVLGLPAFLAGATVVRMLAVVRLARVRHGRYPSRRSDDAPITLSRTGGGQ
jgi:hypothetical protein